NDYDYDGSSVSGAGNNVAWTGGSFDSPPAATQPAVEATVRRSPSPPTVQLHNLFLSPPPLCPPCGPVTFVPTSAVVAPQPLSSSPPSIGRAWPARLQPPPVLANAFPSGSPPPPPPDVPPRPLMQAKLPPEKGRKRYDCLEPWCGMKFSKRNALIQHMRSHTGERPEVCQYCNRGFTLKCNLRRHYKTCKEKKAFDKLAAGTKQDPPSPSSSFGQTPSPSASSPLSITAIASCLDSPPGDALTAPPFLWDPGFGTDPSQQAPAIDMTGGNLFSPQLAYLTPCPPLVQAPF
ncbi:hypothetical protein FRC00_004383, partial [Tulasnella sp. 408]